MQKIKWLRNNCVYYKDGKPAFSKAGELSYLTDEIKTAFETHKVYVIVDELGNPLKSSGKEVILEELTKAQLVDHAKEIYGLDLDGSLKKDELIEFINEAKLESIN